MPRSFLYPLPSFLKGRITPAHYEKWLDGRALGLRRKDKKRKRPYAFKSSEALCKSLIHLKTSGRLNLWAMTFSALLLTSAAAGAAEIDNMIGDHEFVKKVLGAAEEKKLRIQEYRKKGWSIDRLAECVGKKMGISVKKIGRRWRGGLGSDARKAISFLGHRVLGIPVMEIAHYFNISGPAVSMNLDEGESIAGNHGLNKLII